MGDCCQRLHSWSVWPQKCSRLKCIPGNGFSQYARATLKHLRDQRSKTKYPVNIAPTNFVTWFSLHSVRNTVNTIHDRTSTLIIQQMSFFLENLDSSDRIIIIDSYKNLVGNLTYTFVTASLLPLLPSAIESVWTASNRWTPLTLERNHQWCLDALSTRLLRDTRWA